jgi:DNA-binding PadR family transcriptional regulator
VPTDVTLSPTAYVVLGMLHMRPRSGYEIKTFADSSTRFFWAAGYGQIYPELRRLEEAGLISGQDADTGGRRRRVYRIEPAGREALLDWLRAPPRVWELRDDALLRLFFADALEQHEALAVLDRMREASREAIERFRSIRARFAPAGAAGEKPPYPALVLQYGLDFNAWQLAWCDEAERRIRSGGSFTESMTPRPEPDAATI